jgi:hypothetical protein
MTNPEDNYAVALIQTDRGRHLLARLWVYLYVLKDKNQSEKIIDEIVAWFANPD